MENLITIKSKYMNNFKDNVVYKNFTENEIMIIGSIIEKEGLDREDKKKISSVIFNRLNQNMKLQIDATVIYAITKGQYNLKRKLLFKDLKIEASLLENFLNLIFFISNHVFRTNPFVKLFFRQIAKF